MSFCTALKALRAVMMEPPVGVEPTTYALRVRRSSRLS